MKKLYFISFLLMSFILNGQENIFFSEYAEGSSNNKYLEIFNNSAETIDLTQYAFPNVSNAPTTVGEYEYWNTFDDGSTIEPYGIFVIAHPEAEDPILAEADMTSFVYFSNGDDGFKLVYGTEESFTILDEIGDWQGDPGAGWDVAGVTSGTKDHTLVRKSSVQNGNTWSNSAGSTAEDSEWIVYDQNTWTYLGTHEIEASTSEGCDLTISMVDSYGDGWNGGTLDVYVNGALAGTFANTSDAAANEAQSIPVSTSFGDVVTFDFTCGSYCGETSFTVTDADGNVVASGGGSSSADATFECVDPNAVAFSATGSVSDTSATFSFDITNFTVGATDSGADGHIHYSLNGGDAVMVYSSDDLTLTDLPYGTHTIVFSLVDSSHAALDPAVESSVTFTITECSYSISVVDSYGDGWNGNSIELFANGVSIGSFANTSDAAAGEAQTSSFGVNTGDVITSVWTTGSYLSETSYYISDTDGNVVFEASASADPMTEVTASCGPDPIEGSWCEDFDGEAFPAEGWASFRGENGLGEGFDWEASPTYAISGTNSAHVRYENVDGGLAEDWLVTPMFIPDASNNHISFSHRQAYGTDYGSTYAVKISTASQTSHGDFTDIATWTEADFEPSEFTSIEFSLADYIGVPIHVAFVMTNDDGDDWYIDDVCVQAGLSTPDNEILDMRIYPNPVDGNYVTIQSPVQGLMEVEVYTVTGRKVLQTVLTDDKLNVSSFDSGFYMVKVTINGQSKVSKLVVR